MSAKVLQHPEWKLIVQQLKESPYGSEYSTEDLAAFAMLHVDHPRLNNQIQRAKKNLRHDYERVLAYDRTLKKYRVILPEEHYGHGRRDMGKAVRRVKIAMQKLQATPMDKIGEDDQRRTTNAIAHFGATVLYMKGSLKNTRPCLTVLPDVPRLPGAPTEKDA